MIVGIIIDEDGYLMEQTSGTVEQHVVSRAVGACKHNGCDSFFIERMYSGFREVSAYRMIDGKPVEVSI